MGDGNDGNVELSLGLAIGGNSNNPQPEPLKGFVMPPDPSSGDLSVDGGGVSPLLHPDWRREYHARRRKEARIKHEQKLLRRGIVRAKSSPILSVEGRPAKESRNVREPATLDVRPLAVRPPFQMMPVPISYPHVSLVQHGGGYAIPIPCMVSFLAPVVPTTVTAVPPHSPPPSFGRNHIEGNGVGSLGKTSSDVSDYHTTEQQAELFNNTSNLSEGSNGSSNTTKTQKCPEIPRGHSDHNISYHQLASPSNTKNKMPVAGAPSNSMCEPADKPDVVPPQQEKQSESEIPKKHSESEMPFVYMVGDDGKVITGFLSKYTSVEEITIMCKCHGTTFSPAEFVKHAGGSEIEQPLKRIRVIRRRSA